MSLDVSNMRWQAGSALWLTPFTLGSGGDAAKLAGIGTTLKISVIGSATLELPIGSADSKTEYNQYKLANGVTAEVEKRTVTIDGTGAIKAARGDASIHKITVDIAATNLAAIHAIRAIENSDNDGYVLATVPLGDKNSDGFAYLIGKVGGVLKIELAENALKPIQVVFSGLTTAVEATEDLTHTVINAGITSITQPGGIGALHPATAGSTYAIEAGDIDADKLLKGQFLFKPPLS